MHKRFLAIFAIIATVFAFGVGSALAERPKDAGPPDPHPACEKDNAPDWCEDDDGQPGDGDDDGDDGDDGEEGSPLDALCDALGAIDPALTDVCQQIVDALTGGEAPTFPPEEFPPGGGGGEPGGEPSCADIPEEQIAAGCQALVDALTGGEVPEFPPGGGGGEPGGEPSCGDIPEPQLAAGCQALVDALTGGEAPTLPPEGFPPGGGGGEPGGEPSCADLSQIDAALADACQQLVDALAGGGEPGGEPSCADLSQVDQAFADGCQQLLDALQGGEGDPQGLCDAIRGIDPGLAPIADVCDALVAALAGGGTPEPGGQPSCADLSQLDPALASGCQDLLDTIGVPGL